MGLIRGDSCKLYYNSGTDASPTWVLIDRVGDVNISELTREAVEVMLRASEWDLNIVGRKKASADFRLANDIDGTVFDALRAAFFAGTIQQFALVNGAIATAGTQGLKAFFMMENFPWNQPIGQLSDHQVKLALAWHEESGSLVEPSWITISA